MQWEDLHIISTCLLQFVVSYLAVSAKKGVENSSNQDLFSYSCTPNLFAVTATLIACLCVCMRNTSNYATFVILFHKSTVPQK